MIDLPLSELTDCFGLGVAGNFAGHLEQAGEAADFADVDAPATAPKGIFPFYLPGNAGFLGAFPLSSGALVLPPSEEPLNLQIEPEAGVLCEIEYDADGAPRRAYARTRSPRSTTARSAARASRRSARRRTGAAESKGVVGARVPGERARSRRRDRRPAPGLFPASRRRDTRLRSRQPPPGLLVLRRPVCWTGSSSGSTSRPAARTHRSSRSGSISRRADHPSAC